MLTPTITSLAFFFDLQFSSTDSSLSSEKFDTSPKDNVILYITSKINGISRQSDYGVESGPLGDISVDLILGKIEADCITLLPAHGSGAIINNQVLQSPEIRRFFYAIYEEFTCSCDGKPCEYWALYVYTKRGEPFLKLHFARYFVRRSPFLSLGINV